MIKPEKGSVNRRGFLKGAAASAASLAAGGTKTAQASPRRGEVQAPRAGGAELPSPAQIAADTGGAAPELPSIIVEHPASDYMVDVFKMLGIEYVAANPGSSFDCIQESIVHYGGNAMPEFLTCCHEESAVAMAHGYAKIEGRPMMVLLHGTVGLQHASMAIYNAFGDRVPVYMIAGNGRNAVLAHAATDMAAMVRDFVKWDKEPLNINGFGSAAVQAYRLAMTPPMAPVLLVARLDIQESPLNGNPRLPRFTMPKPPAADIDSVREIARQLVAAENPRVNAGRMARTPKGVDLLVELAELLQCQVNPGTDRINFPNRHPLAGNGSGQPDFTLNLEARGGGGRSATISAAELLVSGNYEISPPMAQGDLVVAADAEGTLPSLIEEVRRLVTPARSRVFQERGARHAAANLRTRRQNIEDARAGWDASPVSLPRLVSELWPLIRNEDWSLVSPQGFISNWASRLWNMDKHHRYIGAQGAGGVGYGAPASVGAALANRKYGRLSINIQTDGDMMYAPGILWTAAHHKIPLLTIMHNNRAYHQEVMFMIRVSAWHNRGADRADIGTTLRNPEIDYAKMAQSMGMYGEGPISDPKDLSAALRRGIDRVKRGEPALIDVVTQPR